MAVSFRKHIGPLARSVCDDVQMNEQVAEFVAEARRYCALIENAEPGAASAFENECLVVLLRLYEQILRLPSTDPPDPELPEQIPHEQWQAVFERTAQRTEHDLYWEVYEPFAENKPGPIHGLSLTTSRTFGATSKWVFRPLTAANRTASRTLCGTGDLRLGRTGATTLLARSGR